MFLVRIRILASCLAVVAATTTMMGAAQAQGSGWTPWQKAAYNLCGCGDCAMNGAWGLHQQFLGNLDITISAESMNLGCCYAGAWILYSIPTSWQGLCEDGPPPFVKLMPSGVGPAPGGQVFRNFSAIAGIAQPPTGPGPVHGILGGGSNLYQCPPCSGIYKQDIPVGNGYGEHLIAVVGATDPARLVGVDDADPDRPVVGFELNGMFDNVSFSFDGNTFDLGALGTGSHVFQMPSVMSSTPAVHAVTLRASHGGCDAMDTATLNTSWMAVQEQTDWTLAAIPGMGWKGVRAVTSIDKRRCEWSLPGAIYDRYLLAASICVGSEIPKTNSITTLAGASFSVDGVKTNLIENPFGISVAGKWGACFGDGTNGKRAIRAFAKSGSTTCTMWVGGRTLVHMQGSALWSLSEDFPVD